MHRTPVLGRATVATILLTALVATSAGLAALAGPTQAQAPLPGRTCTLTPDRAGALRSTLAAMSTTTCVTLELAPGSYDVGATLASLPLHAGTADVPLTVRAADPQHPPLITGGLYLAEADHWVLDGLRFRGTPENNLPGQPIRAIAPLQLSGARHTVVVHSEFFSTRGFQNATLLGVGAYTDPGTGEVSYPGANRINGNCFHDASRLIGDEPPGHDHLLYFATAFPRTGPAPRRSTMHHNIFFDSSNGAAVKIDQPDVDARYNTFVHVSEAITVQPTSETSDPPYDFSHSRPLTRIVIRHNLTSRLVHVLDAQRHVVKDRAFYLRDLDSNPNPDGVQVSIVGNQTWNDRNPFLHVYHYNASPQQFREVAPRPQTTETGPRFSRVGGCGPSFYRPTTPALQGYGRYAG